MSRNRVVMSVAAVVVAVLPVAACSGPAVEETPQPSMTPTRAAPASSPTVSAETTLERRMRLDQEAAVTAYRATIVEVDRLFNTGGASKPTPKLVALTTGAYLEFTMQTLRMVKKNDWKGVGSTKVVFVGAQGWSAANIHIKACEDVSKSALVDSEGKSTTPAGEDLYVQDYTLRNTSTGWKVADVTTKPVQNFNGYDCGDK